MSEIKKANPSLQKRSAARTAAIQCLYTRSFLETPPSAQRQVDQLKERLNGNREEQKLVVGLPIEPHYKMVQHLLEGVQQWQSEIDMHIDANLGKEWKRDRLSPVLIAILQSAIFELFFDKDINPRIVINEYTTLTGRFFSEGETDFVHGVLSTLAQQHET